MELTYKWIALANRHYLMYLNKRLASYGLSGSQYLFILNICRQPGLTQDKLPDIIHINKSNVTRALAHLEKRGFIRREVNPQDKRTAAVFPTQKALDVYPHVMEIDPGLGCLGDQPPDGGREAHPAGPAQARGGLGPRVPQQRRLGPAGPRGKAPPSPRRAPAGGWRPAAGSPGTWGTVPANTGSGADPGPRRPCQEPSPCRGRDAPP